MAKKIKYLKLRGDWYHFERSVPPNVRHLIDPKEWRHALGTDSRVEAEARCLRRTVETNEQLKQAREGTYRSVEQTEIEDLAAQWGMDFQLFNRENIAREAFPDVWGELEPFGDEAVRPIIRSKSDLSAYVAAWLERSEIASIKPNTPDFDALLDACLDEYLVSNPEISDGWKDVLAELEVMPNQAKLDTFGTLKRQRGNDPQRKLSAVFDKYLKLNSDLSKSTKSEFGTGVRRFIEFHGDLDIDQIERSHAERFRDGLAQLPVRPPNKIRALTMPRQLDWAKLNETKTLQRKAINKNILGVKLTLDFGYHKTSLIEDRTWRNPFEGFQESGKKGRKARPKGFTDEQVEIVFSKGAFRPKTVERFWIPVILFYTGARLDEISQLHCADVKLSPFPHLVVENLEDEDPVLAKLLKNESSERTIPIHDDLIEIGFFDYVDAIRQNGQTHLFPNLPHERGRNRGGYVSRTFMEGFRSYGQDHPDTGLNTLKLRTHSLRHTYRRKGFKAPEQDFVKIVMGHYVDGESIQTYGWEAYTMPDLLAEKATQHINLPQLDINFLKSMAEGFLAKVQAET